MAGVCVCNVEEQSNKRPKQEKVGCLAHSVWVLNYSFVFLFWVKCCFVFHIAGRSSKKGKKKEKRKPAAVEQQKCSVK